VKFVNAKSVVMVRLPAGVQLAEGVRARQDIGFLQQNERKEVRWKVKAKPGAAGEAEITVSSTRGGVARMVTKIG